MAMEGICIVVTPLIALMVDQVQNLANRGIKALSIYSGMSAREIDITLDNAVYGDYSFLYVSPERLQTQIFIERFKKMKISFIAIDEAHCISQWGYDFRPAYLRIAELKKIKPNIFFLALTATATKQVVLDIQEKLDFENSNVIQSSFVRPNLKYITLNSDNKLDDIVLLVKKMSGSGIIYCQTRGQTKTLYQYLSSINLSVDFYHAGLNKEVRQKKQLDWMQDRTRIIISTNAFGMGIDKQNVRFVIHYDLPDNIESYFQEAGRAGRDLKDSRSVLFFNNKDILNIKEKVKLKYPDISIIKSVYNALGNHLQLAIGSGKEEIYNIDLTAFSQKYNFNFYTSYYTIKILENNNLIQVNDDDFRPSRLKIIVNKSELYHFQVKNIIHNKIIQFILRSHLGIFDEYLSINESIIAAKLNLKKEDIISALAYLKKQCVVDYIPESKGYQIVYLKERLNEQNFSLSSDFYNVRKENAIKKSEALIKFLKNDICRQVYLLNYFNEKDAKPCKHCNVCLNISELSPKTSLKEQILKYILSELKLNKNIRIEKVYDNFIEQNHDHIIKIIRQLNEEMHLKIDPSGRFISK